MDKETLQQTIANARQKLDKIERAERYKEAKHLLGKCFKTRNNYSCPEKPSDYWWLYTRITKVKPNGELAGFRFQTDKNGNVNIEPDNYIYRHMDDWQEISLKEFKEAFARLQNKINKEAQKVLKLCPMT